MKFRYENLKVIFANLLNDVINLVRLSREKPITDFNDWLDFVERQTCFQLQRSFDTYCRMRVGTNWQKLYSDKEFHENYLQASWAAFPLILADTIEMLGITIFRDAKIKAADIDIKPMLKYSSDKICQRQKISHPKAKELWLDSLKILQNRIDNIDVATEKAISEIPIEGFEKVFDKIPFVKQIRDADYEPLLVTHRLLLCKTQNKFRELINLDVFIKEIAEIVDKNYHG